MKRGFSLFALLVVVAVVSLYTTLAIVTWHRVLVLRAQDNTSASTFSDRNWVYQVSDTHVSCRLHVEDDAAFRRTLPAFLECMKQYEPATTTSEVPRCNIEMFCGGFTGQSNSNEWASFTGPRIYDFCDEEKRIGEKPPPGWCGEPATSEASGEKCVLPTGDFDPSQACKICPKAFFCETITK